MLRNKTFVAVSVAVCAAYIGIGLVGPVRILYAQSRCAWWRAWPARQCSPRLVL